MQLLKSEGVSHGSLQDSSVQKLKFLGGLKKALLRRNTWETHHKRLKNFCFRLGKVSLACWRWEEEGEDRSGDKRTVEVLVRFSLKTILCTSQVTHSEGSQPRGRAWGDRRIPEKCVFHSDTPSQRLSGQYSKVPTQ